VSCCCLLRDGWFSRRPRASSLAAIHQYGTDRSPRTQVVGLTMQSARCAGCLRCPFDCPNVQMLQTQPHRAVLCLSQTKIPSQPQVRVSLCELARNSARCGRAGLHHRAPQRRSTRCWRLTTLEGPRPGQRPALCAQISPELMSVYDFGISVFSGSLILSAYSASSTVYIQWSQ
jgi:hypothetical protein